VTIKKIKSAREVLTDFLDEQAQDERLDAATLSAIRELRAEGKLTKINLLRRLEEARNKALKDDHASQVDAGDD